MRFIDAVRVFLGFWLAALIFTFPILVGWLFPIQKRRLIFYTPWLLFSKGVCLIFRIKLDVEGLENLKPGFEKNHLFICNHQSALDIPLLVSQYPIPFLTKKQNLIIPFLGLAGVLAGSIAFDRDKMGERRRVLREIVERVKEHTSLYIFPEGTRSRNGEIQERIYPALLRIAWKSGIDVIPIALH
ncbi:MAG: 1-acyl-sn-glycerol-3-phosphate acyltransferase, partial [Blastocatellia bacterium]|nr:1-acyl-sn-glycerol-3-phosphate acyltransferase [Blastocatellia bacterium]